MDPFFPSTRHSAVEAIRGADASARDRALETLMQAYWKPVYKVLRLHWHASPEDAEDWTQGFFARALEKDFFARYDASKGRFRTFLRTCLDGYVANERRAANRQKRGGGAPHSSLDFETAEGELHHVPLAAAQDPETLFQQEWIRSLFGIALERLRATSGREGKQTAFALFERYDLDGADAERRPTYRDLAMAFDIPETQVTNHLAAMRREFRRLVLTTLRELCGSDAEFRAEAREVLGGEP